MICYGPDAMEKDSYKYFKESEKRLGILSFLC